ncbi:dual specificity protein phosphatase 1-like isoform X1 [Oryza brachyantha]|uniref:dual specificity protein phosphatase 1-like isoform X1 n=1 Tax=Oryza brachyantha TaxID=4533 RepID=UPI000776AC2E|nr:dual specificity protein phosphatase 1-like isoform X1 [Oryza brachyantha]
MSMPEAGRVERDERELDDDYEQQQTRVLMALMQGFCAARYRKADNTPCPIDQGLYLGSVGAALNRDALKSLNITHVLIVARSLNPAFPSEFNYKKIEVLDSPDIDLAKYFDECLGFIDESISSGGNVLVHCFAGRSRSGAGEENCAIFADLTIGINACISRTLLIACGVHVFSASLEIKAIVGSVMNCGCSITSSHLLDVVSDK